MQNPAQVNISYDQAKAKANQTDVNIIASQKPSTGAGATRPQTLKINTNLGPVPYPKTGKMATSVKVNVRKAAGSKDSSEQRVPKAPKTKFLVKMRQPVRQPVA